MPKSKPKPTLEQRCKEFYDRVWEYVKGNGGLDKYDKGQLREFYEYWIEHNEPVRHNTKLRFEREKIFQIGRRLGTWFRKFWEYQETKRKRELRRDPRNNVDNEVYKPVGPVKSQEQLQAERDEQIRLKQAYEKRKKEANQRRPDNRGSDLFTMNDNPEFRKLTTRIV